MTAVVSLSLIKTEWFESDVLPTLLQHILLAPTDPLASTSTTSSSSSTSSSSRSSSTCGCDNEGDNIGFKLFCTLDARERANLRANIASAEVPLAEL